MSEHLSSVILKFNRNATNWDSSNAPKSCEKALYMNERSTKVILKLNRNGTIRLKNLPSKKIQNPNVGWFSQEMNSVKAVEQLAAKSSKR